MNEAPLNSAIVPIYTAEPYLEYRGPDLLEFRICFVDDCSQDNCLAKCEI